MDIKFKVLLVIISLSNVSQLSSWGNTEAVYSSTSASHNFTYINFINCKNKWCRKRSNLAPVCFTQLILPQTEHKWQACLSSSQTNSTSYVNFMFHWLEIKWFLGTSHLVQVLSSTAHVTLETTTNKLPTDWTLSVQTQST